jgi:Fe2+ or Zn2+ uptake regulation protein
MHASSLQRLRNISVSTIYITLNRLQESGTPPAAHLGEATRIRFCERFHHDARKYTLFPQIAKK